MTNNTNSLRIAIVGTAGRDKNNPLNRTHWDNMTGRTEAYIQELRDQGHEHITVISGGAAWADHVAVYLAYENLIDAIELYLPAPIENDYFLDYGWKSAGGIANYYHKKFSDVLGYNTITDIADLQGQEGAIIDTLDGHGGPGALFYRNSTIANNADELLALTMGTRDIPNSSGTLDTWNKFKKFKHHIYIG